MNLGDNHVFWALIGIVCGLGLVTAAVFANIGALVRHEAREFARADEKERREQDRHDSLLREVRDMQHLARGAIHQRVDIEKRIVAVEKILEIHDERLKVLEECERPREGDHE